eukprot:7081073-Alexandrium_andersonii.AAC.1
MVLQVVASARWRLTFGDVSQAFNNGSERRRADPIFAEIPKGSEVPGFPPGTLVELVKSVSGLVSA